MYLIILKPLSLTDKDGYTLCPTLEDLMGYLNLYKGQEFSFQWVDTWKAPEEKPKDKTLPRGRDFKPLSDEAPF